MTLMEAASKKLKAIRKPQSLKTGKLFELHAVGIHMS